MLHYLLKLICEVKLRKFSALLTLTDNDKKKYFYQQTPIKKLDAMLKQQIVLITQYDMREEVK